MISGELPDLAGEAHAAIGQQDFGLADAARIQDDFTRRRIAGLVFVAKSEVEIAERDPACLPAPAHVDDPLTVGQHRAKFGAGLRRAFCFEACNELEATCLDAYTLHDQLPGNRRPLRSARTSSEWLEHLATHLSWGGCRSKEERALYAVNLASDSSQPG